MVVSSGRGIKTKTYQDELGNSVTLILDPATMKQGGEGYIADIKDHPNLIAKIYVDKPTLDGKRISQSEKLEKLNKLQFMCTLYDNKLSSYSAFPQKALFDSRRKLVGFVMDKITDAKKINMLYSYRKTEFPFADWGFMVHAAKNLAIAVNTLHDKNIVIGDINPGNILVDNQAMIKLIDCDSYQVDNNGHLYYCNVGVPEYTPKELQHKSFRGVTRTKNHDCFGLAVMIFQILFFSKHPYSGPGVALEVSELVEKGAYCYGRNSLNKGFYFKLVNALLTDELKDMFERAFSRDKNPVRPTPKEWEMALDKLEKNLRTCSCGHKYNQQASSCIWCDIKNQKKGGYDFFANTPSKQTPYKRTPSQKPQNYPKNTPAPTNNSNASSNSQYNYSYTNTTSSTNLFKKIPSQSQLLWYIVFVFTVAIMSSLMNLNDSTPIDNTFPITDTYSEQYDYENNNTRVDNIQNSSTQNYVEKKQEPVQNIPKSTPTKTETKPVPIVKPVTTQNNTKPVTKQKTTLPAPQKTVSSPNVKKAVTSTTSTPAVNTKPAETKVQPKPVKKVKTDLEQSTDYFFE